MMWKDQWKITKQFNKRKRDQKPHKIKVITTRSYMQALYVYFAYGSDEHAVCLGYFLTKNGDIGPFRAYQFKHFEKGWHRLEHHFFTNYQEIEEFQEYLTAHGIKWT